MPIKMTSNRPYLIRALYEWIVDNEKTPYIVIDVNKPRVEAPEGYDKDGELTLNISPKACQGLHLENDRIVLSARFGNDALQIFTPPSAVLAIYAKETGQGLHFSSEDEEDTLPPTPGPDKAGKAKKKKPKLTVVK